MNNLDSPDYPQTHLSQDLLLKTQSRTKNILGAVAALLERGAVEDEVDRKILKRIIAFIENPTEDLSDIMGHTTSVGQVLSGYEMQGAQSPPEIDAMHGYLVALQCINRINFIEEELVQGSPDSSEVQQAMRRGLGWARVLLNADSDGAFFDAFNELQDRLGNL